jgi:hypothetical protein
VVRPGQTSAHPSQSHCMVELGPIYVSSKVICNSSTHLNSPSRRGTHNERRLVSYRTLFISQFDMYEVSALWGQPYDWI